MARTDGQRQRRLLAAAMVTTVGAALCTVPVLEMGVNDDWSYARTALDLVRTHHLLYNGQSAMILGPHALLGALAVRLFGFSFTAVRLSLLPVTAACTALLVVLGRRCALTEREALFGALALMLSPLAIPLSASFMTDVTGLFFLLAALYAATRTAGAGSARAAIGWAAATAVLGMLGGTVRQFLWLTAIVVLPLAAWLRGRRLRGEAAEGAAAPEAAREQRIVFAVSLALGALGLLFAAAATVWFQRQPHTVSDGLFPTPATVRECRDSFPRYLATLAPTGVLLLLPALALTVSGWRIARRRRARAVLPALGLLSSIAALALVSKHGLGDSWPYWGNVFTPAGPYPGLAIGAEAFRLPMAVCALLAAAVLFFCLLGTASVALWLREVRSGRWARPSVRETPDALVLLIGFSAPYALTLLVRLLAYPWVADRYLLPLLPAALILLLRAGRAGEAAAPPRGRAAWTAGTVTLALFAAYGIAGTHDLFANGRARVAAADALLAAGIPRRHIRVGFEYDCWTEVELAGTVEHREPGAPESAKSLAAEAVCPFPYAFAAMTPDVRGVYFVVNAPQSGLVPSSQFAPVPYRAWLPPFRRTVLVQRLDLSPPPPAAGSRERTPPR